MDVLVYLWDTVTSFLLPYILLVVVAFLSAPWYKLTFCRVVFHTLR